jgi:uncharacterized protein (TIGR02246 family)
VVDVVAGLARAWNAGDSLEFARYFAEDGDMVNIHGMRLRGRGAIAGVYDLLFRSVFLRSRIRPEVSGSRVLCPDAVLLHLRVDMFVPGGKMAGVHDAVSSLVMKRVGRSWLVASLHNTLVTDGVARRGMVPAA